MQASRIHDEKTTAPFLKILLKSWSGDSVKSSPKQETEF